MENMTRKELLKKGLLAGAAVAGASTLLAQCKKPAPPAEETTSAGPASCDDVSGLSEAEKATRTQNAYVAETPDAAKRCDNCALYTQPVGGSACGGCQVVKGPIAPAGYCNLWVAKG